jgi:ubiquinone/menaquinone biosynthesis C-methylase UbiE
MPKHNLKTKRIKSGFNFLAPWYDFFAGLLLGGALMRAQRHWLSQLGRCKNVLIVGGGTGALLSEMLARGIGGRYVYVDISERMIAAARKRIASQNFSIPVEFICGSPEAIAGRKFDLIVTPFVLDCFGEHELTRVMQTLKSALLKRSQWLFADFHIPTGVMGFISGGIVRGLYLVFNLICGLGIGKLPDFARHFAEIGFTKKAEKYFLRGMLVSRIYTRHPGQREKFSA